MSRHSLGKRFLLAILLCLMAATAVARSGLVLEVAMGGMFWSPSLHAVHVAGVEPGSNAERAGFRKGDEILRINDTPIVGRKAREMKAYWNALAAGKPATFLVHRDGREIVLTMMMGD